MARVLLVGQQPETVDFTNPMLPPGMNAERIHAVITLGPVPPSARRNSRTRRGAEAQGPKLRLCGDRRWHSPAVPQPVDVLRP